ncbi:MAG: sugar transferase, partial [Elusimicrobia bacterium]|nr:sugar transferase [Elusimicrobiota bacterium]
MTLRSRKTAVIIGDLAIFALSLALAVFLRRPKLAGLHYFAQNLLMFSPIFILWLLVFYTLGLNDLRRINNIVSLIQDALVAFAVNTAVAITVFYIFSVRFSNTPKTNIALTAFFAHILIFLWRRLWTKGFLSGLFAQRVAFWGSNSIVEEIIGRLRTDPHLGFSVAVPPNNLSSDTDLLIVDAEQLEANAELGQNILSVAVKSRVKILTHLDFYEELYAKIPPEYAAKPTWLFSNVLSKKSGAYETVKPKIDFLTALFILAATSPLLVLISAAIKISDGESPFYRQKRIGYLGKEFTIIKFRTMTPDAEKAGPLYSADGRDKRITAIG